MSVSQAVGQLLEIIAKRHKDGEENLGWYFDCFTTMNDKLSYCLHDSEWNPSYHFFVLLSKTFISL